MTKHFRFPFAVTDPFDSVRRDPETGRTRRHRGADAALAAGTTVPAFGDGTVALIDWFDQLGGVVVLKHTRIARDKLRGRVPVYIGVSHVEPAARLYRGAAVKLGDPIATVAGRGGSTGSAWTGPHVHVTASHHFLGIAAGEVFDPIAYMRRYPQPGVPAAPVKVKTITVRRGDSVWSISREHNVAMAEVLALNNLPDPDDIRPGQKLKVPA